MPQKGSFSVCSPLVCTRMDPARVAKFKANEFKALRSEAATLFNDVVNRDFAGEQDYVNGYRQQMKHVFECFVTCSDKGAA